MRFAALVLLVVAVADWATAFTCLHRKSTLRPFLALSSSTDDFTNFASSLEEEEDTTASPTTAKRATPKSTARPQQRPQQTNTQPQTWQEELDELLDPQTNMARRQIILSDLLNANEQIRESVLSALRDGNIDPLLTPTGKKLREGTRAVARQLANDILPSLARSSSSSTSSSTTSPFPPFPFPPPPLPFPQPDQLTKVGTRVLNALQNQVKTGLEDLQEDLQDPATNIPKRLSKLPQPADILQEAGNIFSETPAGLQEPPYTVVATAEEYEIRDYAGYTAACTNIGNDNDNNRPDNNNNLGQQGAAFNSLAAYLFGANRQGQVMDMTTPVTTTMSGEMRFYLNIQTPPEPLEQDQGVWYETDKIRIVHVPPARLAVRRFTGFCTKGEVARQKDALLAALQLDGDYELDVAHGQTVGHVIFQYNPPYTLPVIRRNEIAVPILKTLEEDDTVIVASLSGKDNQEPDTVMASVNGSRISDSWVTP